MNDNPFVGLRPFESDESLLFFGRQDQTTELLQRLHRYHFVGVVGSSGSGKSSLLRAGLIPRLKAGYLVNERDRWLSVVFKPGEGPLYNFVFALLQALELPTDAGALEHCLQQVREEGSAAIIQLLQPLLLQNRTNVFILADQFEELFRFSMETSHAAKKDEAIDFVNILLELASNTNMPLFVVIAMRSDFIGDCAQFFGLPEALNKSQYLVPRLTREQLKNAIEGPVRLYGKTISPALTSKLLNDAQTVQDELPLLQHVLMRTWQHAGKEATGDELTLANYNAVGTIQKALSMHADEAIAGMDADELLATRLMFQALTTTDAGGRKTRRPARVQELAKLTGASVEKIRSTIAHFNEDKRSFLVINESSEKDDPLIDISHESLIRQWETLGVWVDEETESAKNYLRLTDVAALHRKGKQDLLDGTELQVALDWQAAKQPNAVWAARYNSAFADTMAYIEESRQQAELEKQRQADALRAAYKAELQQTNLRRRNNITIGVAVVVGLFACLSTWLYFQARKANAEALVEKNSALAQSQRAQEESRIAKLKTDTLQAVLNSLNAVKNKLDTADRKELAGITNQLEAGIKAGTFTIDVYYLEDLIKESRPRAQKIVSLLQRSYPQYKVNLKFLPSATNSKSKNGAFNIEQNMIHCEKSESALADAVLEIIKANKVFPLEQPVKRFVSYRTPNYISVFVRNM